MPTKYTIPPGTRFTRLVVIEPATSVEKKARSRCVCDCGQEKIICNTHLRTGVVRSCGCLGKFNALTHGHRRGINGRATPTYKSWSGMIQRCNNPKNRAYKDYGGRGIRVHPGWVNSFKAFLNYIGPCPKGLTIDRINNAGNYEPGNVRWATMTQQCRNNRHNNVLTVRGKTACIKELCEFFGIGYTMVMNRLVRGWSVEDAFFRPKRIYPSQQH